MKQRRLKKRQKQIEDTVNLLLSTPNLSLLSQVQIIEGGFKLLREEQL